jgi:hypothetical protein
VEDPEGQLAILPILEYDADVFGRPNALHFLP